MTPSWYDLLAVDEHASADEIRAAWRAAVADLDPTDRRFGVLNEAAAVLLDPARRAAYDAELAGAARDRPLAPTTEPEPEPEPTPEPAAAPEQPRRRLRMPALPALPRRSAGGASPAGPPADDQSGGRRVPPWLLLVLLGSVLALVGTAVWVATSVPSDEEVREATRQAQAAAERAIVPVLSYDYRTLEDDRAEAVDLLTEDFREEYEALFDSQIEPNATNTRAVVDTEVLASAIVRGGADRAQILLFIDQPTTNASTTEPVTYRNQVTVRLERVDGRWLVDDLETT